MARGKADQIDFQAQIINEAGNTDALEKTIEIVQAEVGSPKQVMFLPQSRVETYQDMYPEVNFGDRTVAVPYKGGVVVGTPEAMKKANNLFQAEIKFRLKIVNKYMPKSLDFITIKIDEVKLKENNILNYQKNQKNKKKKKKNRFT